MANITRLCSTFCLSHLSFQLRIGPVKEKLLDFLSLLAKNQQQTIIDASGISELSQEQLLIICRRMEMHGHKELRPADYIGNNEEEIKEFYKFPIIEDKEEYKSKYFVKKSVNRIYIFKDENYVIKAPKQTIEQYEEIFPRSLQNLLVEQQMIQVLAYNDENILTQMSEVIVLKNNKFVYYLAYKPLYELYEEIRDPARLLRDSVLLASYLNELHMKTRLYHGDIKPANIFMYPNGIGLLRTDCDSLVSLYHQTSTVEEVYQVRSYTKGYASEQLISLLDSAVANDKCIFFSQQFLLEEDFRQFKTTVMKIFQKTKSSKNYDPLLYQFMEQLVDPAMKTVEQFFDSLLFSPNFFKDFIIFLRDKNNYSFSKGFQAFIPMLIDHIIKERVWFFRNQLLWDTSNTLYREMQIDQDLELNLYFIQDLSQELVFKQRSEQKYEEAIQRLLSLRSKREGGQVIQIARQDLKWLDKLREISKVYMQKLVNFLEQKKETEESVQEGKIVALNLLKDFAKDPYDPKQSQLRLMIDSLIFTLWRTITCINHSFTTLRDRILTEYVDFVSTTIQLYTSDDDYKTIMLNHFKMIIGECFYIQEALA
ncbi:hypothetical protein FGO68_gene1122 [Halteria grandinella]|uniref:Uncharacterized protein n=1 Tax=Halteria grandinella TaxID=5974 RepID=A0A8J8T5R0_HALGN|nr:hypothetical protein FGO68_gene1122 [Halteria grandinella]